jgi:nitroreductase
MDVLEALRTRIEVREYAEEAVDAAVREDVFEAARLASSGKNTQHWRFVLVDEDSDLARLADLSTTGAWIDGADFAAVVVTDPDYYYHELDAGRAITHMQLAAWEHGVGSCIYTGYDETGMREFLEVPDEFAVSAVVGFGYPTRDIEGRKSRRPLGEVAFADRFGTPLELD